MNFSNYIYNSWDVSLKRWLLHLGSTRRKLTLVVSLLVFMMSACTDELDISQTNPTEDSGVFTGDPDKYVVIPIGLNIGRENTSRSDADTQADNEFQNGTSVEHLIDFSTDKECFAILFKGENFFKITRLYQNSSLGSGNIPTDGIGEYQIYAVAYIEKPENWDYRAQEDDETDEAYAAYQTQHNIDRVQDMPDRILVVLNGGRIYSDLLEYCHINPDGTATPNEFNNVDKFLSYQWRYDVNKTENSNSFESRLQVIGTNRRGYFTMTNSAYYGPDDDSSTEDAPFTLQTVRPIDRSKIVTSIASNIIPSNSAATVYLERMVAKFSAPKFPYEMIGSDKVFIPSQNARPVMIYSYNGTNNTWNTEETRWRVHVLGWTINGREKSNYLFKHIKEAWGEDESGSSTGNLAEWERKDWNNPLMRRSYWSIDPHYECNPDNEDPNSTADYYPWQFRPAMDKKHISWTLESTENEDDATIALRYLTFNEINKWYDEALTISENTFNPFMMKDNHSEYSVDSKSNYLDGRGTLLMGPHLLVAAEIYLAAPNESDNQYVSPFSRVENLYGDRYFRYYRTEVEMFRMFVKDVDDALRTQQIMSFTGYNWNIASSGDQEPVSYEAVPTGDCALMIDCDLGDDYFLGLSDEEQEIYTILINNHDKYHGKKVVDMIDDLKADLVDKGHHLFIEAPIKDGDARVIPWMPGIVFRNTGKNKFDQRLEVKVKNGEAATWDDHLRKSLILQWFGPVDHYYRGYMYYAADIPHYIFDSVNKKGYYGAVRNHWYTFTVTSINALGTPVANPGQRIIPGRYKYEDQMSVYVNPLMWHDAGNVNIDFN